MPRPRKHHSELCEDAFLLDKTTKSMHESDRHEICQKIYTTRFLGQHFYTLTVCKLRLFVLTMKQHKTAFITVIESFLDALASLKTMLDIKSVINVFKIAVVFS